MDMVKHVNESLKEKAIPVLILPGLKRVEKALYNCAANAMTELKRAVGSSARKTARERVRKIYLWWSDVCSPHDLAESVEEYKASKEALEETAEALLEGIWAALSSKEEEVEHLENMNK